MCDCALCQRNRGFAAQLAQLPEAQRPYFEALYDHLLETEMDRDYYQALLDGTWPAADHVIAQRRARRAEKQAVPALAAP